jgi:SAM-dependent methyltransferase
MSDPIINLPPDLASWLETAPGQALLDWEQAQMDAAVADVFGYHALQLGMPQIKALRANRMPHKWKADRTVQGVADRELGCAVQFNCDFEALPFSEASLDLVVMPHALEHSLDPHASLREAARVLVPEGRVVICGFNPTSLWGWKQGRERFYERFGMGQLYLPDSGEFLGYWRLRDWLKLLGFEVESSNFGLWQPAVRSEAWLSRMAWMNSLGARYWPILGAAYCVVAVKRVQGMRLISPAWKRHPSLAAKPVAVAPRSVSSSAQSSRQGGS